MKRLIVIMAFTLFIIAISNLAYGDDIFDGLEGVIILTPDENANNTKTTSTDDEKGLNLSITGCTVESVNDTYCNVILEAKLMNWDISSFIIEDTISSTLVYMDEYSFSGVVSFDNAVQINMLEELNGTITFTVPNIVASAEKDDYYVEMTVQGEKYYEEVIIKPGVVIADSIKVPFEYTQRESDALELSLGSMYLVDSYKGDKDEKYKWIIQDISLINWSEEPVSIEDVLYVLLIYKDKYGFEAQIDLPQTQLQTLEAVNGILAFHIPVIVTTAEDDVLLNITLDGEEKAETIDLSKTSVLSPMQQLFMLWPEAESIKDELHEFNGHIYLVSGEDSWTWEEAKLACEEIGGHLVTITSQEEMDFIQTLFNMYNTDSYWLGGYRNDDSGWHWVTDEPFEYTYWYTGQPDGGNGVVMQRWNGAWDDTYNDRSGSRRTICEWDF